MSKLKLLSTVSAFVLALSIGSVAYADNNNNSSSGSSTTAGSTATNNNNNPGPATTTTSRVVAVEEDDGETELEDYHSSDNHDTEE